MTLGLVSSARAVGESYTIAFTPNRILESASSGVTISVTVTNAMFSGPGIPYAFSWTVVDPAGTSRSATSNVLSTTSSWSFSVSYPSSFSGASLNLPGTYTATVSETLPTPTSNVISGTFSVGITDSNSYQRTTLVRIQAGGYLPTDTVNVTVSRPGTIAAFTTSKTPDTGGLVSTSWQTLPGTIIGNYSVIVTGMTTPPKGVPDRQWFIVYPTNITVTNFGAGKTALQRSEVQSFKFNASYLGGQPFTQGSCAVDLTEPDHVTTHVASATYNSTLGVFAGIYNVPLNGQTGAWNATVRPLCLADQYGNGGPLRSSTLVFNVLPASLVVLLSSPNQIFGAGETISIQATILTPGGTSFSQGSTTATMTLSGGRVGTPVNLSYDTTRAQWVGTYKIAASDPSGAWLVTVSATDGYGNSGQSSVIDNVSVQGLGSTSSMFWSYLVIVLLVGLLGFIILITRKRGLARREVKLDLQAIKSQADKVKDDDFLKSIHAQLQRKKQEVGLEKSEK